jgi:hypothetical protein
MDDGCFARPAAGAGRQSLILPVEAHMRKIALVIAALAFATACQKQVELASDGGGSSEQAPPPEAADKIDPPPSPPIDPDDPKGSFPDYQPKTTPDTVADFRSSVMGDISALPSEPAALAQAFIDWNGRAASNPGAFEDGAIMLGADEKQYVPSDAELVAHAAGDRLVAALASADAVAKEAAEAVLATGSRDYKRFDFRHSDVMGSGRYFYASAPRPARIPG